jgi:hypothetical protein
MILRLARRKGIIMSSRVCLKLLRIGYYSDLHATRFVLALSELIWAITLLWPGDTFGRPTYKFMSQLIPSEELWGIIWLFSAITQFYILITGKYHERPSVIFAGFNSILWWTCVISMYLSVSPIPAAISGEAALAFAASWIYVRSGWIPQGSRRSHADLY